MVGLEPLRQLVDDRQHPVVLAGEDLPLEQVHRLGEAGRLEQTTVIGVVPVLEELRAQLVPLDEETALVVGGEVHRADHPVAPAPGQPGLGRIEQRSRDLGVVRALEEAEQPPLVSLELVQALVDVGADPADRLIATPGEEVLRLGVLEERVPAAVEVALALGDQ